ncbi:hypothetical protein K490DRAFT_60282 [Saccharata proteae CBS 121410]|uniref:Nab2-like CCCH zinc finger domain-containing protein n=1 Tax=Saccharata proteae CBS 121410 TaxID=1314787 RepID=A0A9P4HL93_9PEZI|nr:hypothetical protein K490DRAFT_60282 [Saccharata proteae CBS 121410]
MAVELAVGTPLAEALHNVVQPKLTEVGWSMGDDSALTEYIILMLVNGKTQEQIASELSNDLLGLGPDDPNALEFSRWLFEQVDIQNAALNGAPAAPSVPDSSAAATPADAPPTAAETQPQDSEMSDTTPSSICTTRPTGPKAMRDGKSNGSGVGTGKRMMGHLNKAMDRTGDSTLHRVRGNGRINSHAGREPPRGPRAGATANRNTALMNGFNGMNGMGMTMPGGMMPPSPAQMAGMSYQQQMEVMKSYEQIASQMSQVSQMMMGQGLPVQPFINPAFQKNQRGPNSGKSLFDRVDSSARKNGNRPQHSKPRAHQDSAMMDGDQGTANGTADSMEVETKAPFDTLCKFNAHCTKPDCPFAHQSPAAAPGITVDLGDECSFGVRCKNFKCVGKHPSPAQKTAHQQAQECRFWPNCTNPHCVFQHPPEKAAEKAAPMCRNGGDCSTPGCTFTHNQTKCKFNPCKNSYCMFKHDEGQKGAFGDKVWKAGGEKEHVSERKFIDDTKEEELILPGRENQEAQDAQDGQDDQGAEQGTQYETQQDTQITI